MYFTYLRTTQEVISYDKGFVNGRKRINYKIKPKTDARLTNPNHPSLVPRGHSLASSQPTIFDE